MRFCTVFPLWLAIAGLAGCWGHSVPPPSSPTIATEPSVPEIVPDVHDPQAILDRMVTAYKAAISYSDRATVQIIGKMSQSDAASAPWNCIVAFQRPGRLRLEVNDGIFVSDGEDCYAQIRLLPDQVLHFPTPAQWTFDTLFQDVHLDTAMTLELPHSVLRFPPQLVLLFADNPLNTFCPRGATVEWIAQRQMEQSVCDVIQISYSDGDRILWISQDDYALLRMDYRPVGLPVPEGFESIEAIRFEMTDAQFDGNFVSETFQMLQPQDAVQVTEFHSEMPGLPTPEEHRRRLRLMTDSDLYRLADPRIETIIQPEQSTPPKTRPRTFTLSRIWMQSLIGADTMAFLPDDPQKLLIPCEGNIVAILDLQGNVLQKIAPAELEGSIIRDIQSNSLADIRKIGILTLDNTFYLFDESFKPLAYDNVDPGNDKKEEIWHFRFVPHCGEELLLLAVSGAVRALNPQGTIRWEYLFDGVPNHIALAMVENQHRVLVSCTTSQDLILMLSPEGTVFKPVKIDFGRHVLWFQVEGSTIYALYENTDKGEVRFIGFDMLWQSQWSRLLPFSEYEVEPVYVPREKKWFVPLPNGEIWVFDLIGNVDTLSLNIIPTGLLCLEVDDETLLIIADGKTVSAWKIGK